jgi:flagellar biosynthesis protein FlhB
MRALNELIIRFSRSIWLFALSVVVAFGTLFAVLLPIGNVFPGLAGGATPFDLQNDLQPDEVFDQLEGYTEAARQLYYAFSFADFFFPVFASLFLGAVAAFSLRHLSPRWYAVAEARNLFVLFMLGAMFDWLENIFALTAVGTYPDTPVSVANLLVLAKQGKLALVMSGQAVAWLLLLLAALRWVAAKLGFLR